MSKTEHKPSLTPEHFADQVAGLYAAHQYTEPNVLADKAHTKWRLLDPIETVTAPEVARPRLYASLGKVAAIMEDAAAHRGTRKKLTLPNSLLSDPAPVRIEVALDAVEQGLITPGVELSELRHTLNETLDYSDRMAGRRGVEKKDMSFSHISARALDAHIKAREIMESRLPDGAKRNMLAGAQAMIWGLTKDTVDMAQRTYNLGQNLQAKGKHPGSLPGRAVEAMYLGYRLFDWYNAGDPAGAYSRFGLLREDKPLSQQHGLPRKADVVSWVGSQPELIQVKAARAGSTPPGYGEGIVVWAPPAEKHAVDTAPDIFKWFDTVLSNEQSEAATQLARNNLRTYFEGNHFQGGRPTDRQH